MVHTSHTQILFFFVYPSFFLNLLSFLVDNYLSDAYYDYNHRLAKLIKNDKLMTIRIITLVNTIKYNAIRQFAAKESEY